MRLLDRYLLRELLVPLAYCLGGFLIFWIAFDLFTAVDEFQERNLTVLDVLEFYMVKTPEMLSVVLPVALLLGLLYALTNHARCNELTAIRAAGTSLWRLSLPYLAVGFLFSAAVFAANEWWAPQSAARLERILNRRLKHEPAERQWQRDLYFRNDPEQRHWRVAYYRFNPLVFSNLNVQWYFPNGGKRDIYADSGVYSNGVWVFSNVQNWTYATTNAMPDRVISDMERFTFSESPELIRSEIKINNLSTKEAVKRPQLSIHELREYFRLHPHLTGKQAALLYTQFHGRLAEPWTCLVVVLIALPFGAPSGRRNVFVGVAASIFICFAFYILRGLGLTLGTGGQLPAWLAAWLPNIVVALTGIVLTCRVR